MSEKVSIIIPIYNVQEYIDACVESACKQTYADLEIILVDDGSTDLSGDKCDKWRCRDSRIKVIHKTNGGLSSARNTGLDVATGTYIYFLDGDDYIENDLLEKVIPYMQQSYDMVSFCYYAVYEHGEREFIKQLKYGSFSCNDELERQRFLINILLKGRIGWAAWSRVYRRDIIEKYNLRFADNRRIFAEDLYFCLCYCSHAKAIISTDRALYNYRKRQDSIMGQQAAKLNIGRMNELGKEVLKHYSSHKDCEELLGIFPAIHFMIIGNVIDSYQSKVQLSLNELREQVLQDVNDFDFFQKTLLNIKSYRGILCQAYSSRTKLEEMLNTVQYILDGRCSVAKFRQQCIKIIAKLLRFVRK